MKMYLLGRFGLTALLAAAATTAVAQPPLSGSQRTNGVLGGSDPRDADGNFYDQVRYTLRAGQSVTVTANRADGSELDPVVEVYGPGSASPLFRDDDGGGYPNARLAFTAPRAGIYTVRVRSFGSSRGAYDLTLSSGGGQPPLTGQLQTYNSGNFNDSVPRRDNGAHYRDYRVTLSAGEFLVLRMQSSSFDSYLFVYDAGNEGGTALASNDDFGTLDSALLFRAPRAGTYTIRASQLSHGDGAYVLRSDRLR